MRWNKKYNYPSSSRATEDGIRRYVLGETKLPSVTSILDATKSEEDKAALANWRERTGQFFHANLLKLLYLLQTSLHQVLTLHLVILFLLKHIFLFHLLLLLNLKDNCISYSSA